MAGAQLLLGQCHSCSDFPDRKIHMDPKAIFIFCIIPYLTIIFDPLQYGYLTQLFAPFQYTICRLGG